MKKEKLTIVLTETGELTAGVLEIARVARAITCTRERVGRSQLEISATFSRLKNHLRRAHAHKAAQLKCLAQQQKELRRQIARVKQLKGAK